MESELQITKIEEIMRKKMMITFRTPTFPEINIAKQAEANMPIKADSKFGLPRNPKILVYPLGAHFTGSKLKTCRRP
jgi:hypothetical protein